MTLYAQKALGENNMFRKFHNAELTTRVPFVVAVPWLPEMHGKHSQAIIELVDVMPTLIGLANLPQPNSIRDAHGRFNTHGNEVEELQRDDQEPVPLSGTEIRPFLKLEDAAGVLSIEDAPLQAFNQLMLTCAFPNHDAVRPKGINQAAVLADVTSGTKHYALSQYPRCPTNPAVMWKRNWCIEVASDAFQWMGYGTIPPACT